MNKIDDDKQCATTCLTKAGLNEELFRTGNTKVFRTVLPSPSVQPRSLCIPKNTLGIEHFSQDCQPHYFYSLSNYLLERLMT